MRHLIVTRIVLVLCALFVVAVGLFAWASRRPPAHTRGIDAPAVERTEPSGAALFDRHCAGCHDIDSASAGLRNAPDPDRAAGDLREFLTDHHGPSPEGITRIVSHLEQAAKR